VSSSVYANRLQKLLKKLKPMVDIPEAVDRSAVDHLIHAFMVWNSSLNQADEAYVSIMESVVDHNDLRVTDPLEIVEAIGTRYPLAEERAHRLKMALHGVYLAEYATELKSLAGMSKKDARQYLATLDGMVSFVAASVVLLSLGGHAIPVDDTLLERMKADGVVDPDASPEVAQAFLEHQVKASQSLETYYILRAYVERPIKSSLPKLPASKVKKTGKKVTHKIAKKVGAVAAKRVEAKKIVAKKVVGKMVVGKKVVGKKVVAKKAEPKPKPKPKPAKKVAKATPKKTTKKAAKKTTKKAVKKAAKKAAKKTTKKKK
jgi:hypothetical protein